MTLLRAIADRIGSRRDVFVKQGIPAESLMGPSWSGVRIDQGTASRMIAIHAAWSLLADSAGLIPYHAFAEEGDARVRLPDPDWLYQPVPDDPSITWDEHCSQLVVSLASDGNSFTLALPEVLDPSELRVLDPERIEVRRVRAEPRYHYRPEGGGLEVLGPDQVIHISRLRRPGALRGLSPIEEAAQSLGKVRSADKLGARVFQNAILLSGYVAVPGALSPEGHELLRDEIVKQYAGAENAGKPGIFANGAEWKVPAPNLEHLQLVELLRWGVLDVARLYHIPPRKLGDNSPGSMSYSSVEQTAIEWVVDGVRPYVQRIEAGYRRLLPGRETYLHGNIDGLLRGDFKTRMEAMAQAVQSRLLLIDEARALEERPPMASFTEAQLNGPGGLLRTPNNSEPVPGRQTT